MILQYLNTFCLIYLFISPFIYLLYNVYLSIFNNSSINYFYNYELSSEMFVEYSKMAGARTEKLLVVNRPYIQNLYINVAVFQGNDEKMILHISGTHGVEGYTGSAIQTNILKNYNHDKNGPTVVMIHGLNPFGMKYLRRVNENNVDLNRNSLFTDEDWEKAKNRDNTIYEQLDKIINPKYSYNGIDIFHLWDTLYKLLTMGLTNFKRGLVSGTYSNDKGVFYGGRKLEESHKQLFNFLQMEGYLENIKQLVLIDVHTGLGKFGKDTLMVSNGTNKDIITEMFSGADRIVDTHNGMEGYELTMGDVADNYPKLFKNLSPGSVVSITQEFGTYHNILVGLSLVYENQGWNWGSNYHNLGENLYQIFTPNSRDYYDNVVKRGKTVFKKAINIF